MKDEFMTDDLFQLFENAGVALPNENSLGNKIILDDDHEKLLNFWTWFGDSKMVDKRGRPLVLYHGSKHKFTSFDPFKSSVGYWSTGFYFTTKNEPTAKEIYNRGAAQYGKHVYPVYLRITKPLILKTYKDGQHLEELLGIDTGFNKTDKVGDSWAKYAIGYRSELSQEEIRQKLVSVGYDGIINAGLYSKQEVFIVAFEPNQIKSVENKGTFFLGSSNIYECLI